MSDIQKIFSGSNEAQALKVSLEKLEEHISHIRNVSKDPRASLKVKISLEDLEWEREKLVEKIDNLS